MQIQVNTDNHLMGREDLVESVQTHVEKALGRFAARLTRVEVYLGDENSAKRGADDKRCLIEAHPAGHQSIAASHYAPDLKLAISGALDKIEKSLDRTLGRIDERKRQH